MKSLSAQLTLRLLIGAGLLLGAAGAASYWQMSRALTAEFDATLRATAQSFAALTEQKNGRVELEFDGESMPEFEGPKGPAIFSIRFAGGREIERSRSLGQAALPSHQPSFEAPVYFDFALPDGRDFRCIETRYDPHRDDEDEDHGRRGRADVVLVVGKDRVPLDRTLGMLRASLLLVGAAALALLVAIVRWSVRSSLRPLELLGRSVAEVDSSSLSRRFPVEHLPMELRPITTRLNELLARLESAFERERRFTAAAAHELRTPLAELRTLAEVNLTTPATPAERADSWSDALATTRRMESLALRLLELSRAENSAHVVRRESIPVSDAVASAWQPWAERAARRGVVLDLDIPPSLTIPTDGILFGVVLGNLCANAAQHAAANSSFRVSAATAPDRVTLKFRNLADNLAEADMPHLFERFWRKEVSRTEASHHGFGLSLATEFAALLGASLSAILDADGNVEFRLCLPARVS